jgi:hypothetical protein
VSIADFQALDRKQAAYQQVAVSINAVMPPNAFHLRRSSGKG